VRSALLLCLLPPCMPPPSTCSRRAKELRPLRSVFNLLGPLTNPARASAQVVGVYSEDLVEKLAQALKLLGLQRGPGRAWQRWTG